MLSSGVAKDDADVVSETTSSQYGRTEVVYYCSIEGGSRRVDGGVFGFPGVFAVAAQGSGKRLYEGAVLGDPRRLLYSSPAPVAMVGED
eukprot:gene33456-40476_t